MTFSLDVDLWSIQTVPAQDAASRAGDSVGRGVDFAASLFAAEPDFQKLFFPAEPVPAADTSALAFAALPVPFAAPAIETPLQFILTDAPAPDEVAAPAPLIYPAAQEIDAADVADMPEAPAAEAAEDTGSSADIPAPILPATAPAAEPARAAATETSAAVPEAAILAVAAGGARTMAARPGAPETATDGEGKAAATPPHSGAQPALTDARAGPAPELNVAGPDAAPDLPISDKPHPADTTGAFAATAGSGADAETPAAPAPAPQGPGLASAAAPAPFLQPPSQPIGAAQPVPTPAVLVATATEIPALVARASTGGSDERLTVQLDPPELGRVSIDFKFDAQGLQHVTVTAETPEAMRQLRAMHFELIQALERSGFTGQEMSFQQGPSQQQSAQNTSARALAASSAAEPARLPLPPSVPDLSHLAAGSGRLDIKL